MSTSKKAEPTTYTKRVITAVQSKGSLGKSTLSGHMLEWCRYAGIPVKAVDSDAAHQSLRSRYPECTSRYDATKSQDAFGLLIDHLPKEVPIVIWDFPANFTPQFLTYAAHYRLRDVFERKGWRPTLFIFISDDGDARRSATDIVTEFGEDADYVMIDNPKLFQSSEFRRTGLFKRLSERGAPLITMPEISKAAQNCWEDLETREDKGLSIGDVIAHEECSPVAYFELSGVLDLMFRQFEDAAQYLVPEAGLIARKVTRVSNTRQTQRGSRYRDPLFTKE
jgi:hypothetical protein